MKKSSTNSRQQIPRFLRTIHTRPAVRFMRVVGLTGGIATGKSYVLSFLMSNGVPVLDCDKIAFEVVMQGRWGYRRVVKALGPDILLKNGDINRDALMDLIVSNHAARRKLNAATHLPIGVEILRQLFRHWMCHHRLVVVDMPLLIETGAYRLTWPRVLVYCPPDINVERLMKRDKCSMELAQKKIAAQMPLDAKRDLCQYIIDNSGTREETAAQVAALLRNLQEGLWWRAAITSPVGLFSLAALALAAWLAFVSRRS